MKSVRLPVTAAHTHCTFHLDMLKSALKAFTVESDINCLLQLLTCSTFQTGMVMLKCA